MSVNESPLLFSGTLAQTIGLNEAILFQYLQQNTQLTQGEFTFSQEISLKVFCFWNLEQIHHVFMSLNSLGLIELSQSQGGSWVGKVSLGAPVEKQVVLNQSEPIADVQLAESLEVEVLEIKQPQSEGLITQAPVIESKQEVVNNQSASNFAPSEIQNSPVRDSVNEARLYNQNRGNPLGHLQQPKSTPIYSQSQSGAMTSLSKMNANWKPSEQFHEMLRLHNIPAQFADEQLPVFKQYYIDSGKTAMSWDSRFINWVQRAKASVRSQEGQYEQKQSYPDTGHSAKQRKEEVRQKLRDINDTSWAD